MASLDDTPRNNFALAIEMAISPGTRDPNATRKMGTLKKFRGRLSHYRESFIFGLMEAYAVSVIAYTAMIILVHSILSIFGIE